MAKITDFLSPALTTDTEFGIEAKMFVWLNAGSGKVQIAEPFLFGVEGRISVVGHERTFALQLALSDQDPSAEVGPASMKVDNEVDGDAVYKVQGDELVLLGKIKNDTVRIILKRETPDGRRTLLELSSPRDIELRLTPG